MSDTTSKGSLIYESLADLAREYTEEESKLLSYIPYTPRRQQANNLTGLLKKDAEEAFKAGIKYRPPRSLVSTSGVGWAYQPHPDLYETLATNVLEHYNHYKEDRICKTHIPTYFFLGGAGTGKSRHASEFTSSVQKAITLHTQHHELAQRLKKPLCFMFRLRTRHP